MSDTQRCEPPEHLRGVDGWHWVQAPVGEPFFARWHPAERDDVEPLWTSTHHVYAGTPRYAVREWGWRYLAPVTPPSTVAALVEALEGLMMGSVWKDAHTFFDGTPMPPGWSTKRMPDDDALTAARAALALYRGEVA